jgi:hypothetical protein
MTAFGRIGEFGDGSSSAFQSVDGQGGPVTVPGGDWLLYAKFSHAGADLLLTGEDGAQVLVRDYFAQMTLPDLITDHGAVIGGDLAARLAGPVAPGQYAQAGDAPTLASVGSVTKLSGDASVRHADGTSSPLKQGDQIFQGDVIQTGANGQIGVTFDDGAVFSLGQKGRMTVDEMTWDPATAKGAETLSVITGPFSFVSGEIAKTGIDAMSIKTPVATIGVRGTTGAGFAAPEGQPNRITLMPNADGTVGELAVSNQAGVQVMSVPGATTQVASAFVAPPVPTILTPQQIQQQYGGALQVLPPPPTQQQIQQNLQQKGSQAPTEKAVQTAQATAAEKTAAEKVAGEKAAAADKALGEKLGTEKAEMAKLAAEKGLAEGLKLAEAKIADALSQTLGLTQGQFGDTAAKVGDAIAKAAAALGPVGPLGPMPPAGFDLASQINLVGAQIQSAIQQGIQNQINQIMQQAANQPTTTHSFTGTTLTVGPTDGVNDQILGRASEANALTLTAPFGVGDSFTDPTLGDGDSVKFSVGTGTTNTVGIANVELIDLTGTLSGGTATIDQGLGIKNVDIGSDGDTTIYASYGIDNLTGTPISSYAPTGNQTWSIYGHLGVAGSDAIDMAGGTDTLSLLTTGSHTINAISNVENLQLANGTNTVTFQAPISGITITGNAGTDTLNLANVANALTISSVDSVVGGSGTDSLTLGSGGQSVHVQAIETITGGSGTDVVTMGAAGTIGVSGVEVMTGSSGVDTISFSGPSTGNTSTLIGGGGADTLSTTSNGGSIIVRYEATGDFGDTVTNFQAGGTTDVLNFLVSGFTGADKLLTTGDGSTAVTATSAGATISFQTVSAAGNFTATAANEVFIFSASVFSSAAVLQTALQGGANSTVITLGNAGITNGGRFLAAYDNGSVTRIATVTIGNVTDSTAATVTDVATLNNVSDVTTLTTADFNCV